MSAEEKNCKWHFSDQPGGQRSGPNNPTNENFKSDNINSLIREVIQNSLDARKNFNEPVVVRFSFRNLKPEEFPELLNLESTFQACKDYYPKDPQAQQIYNNMLDSLKNMKKNKSVECLCIYDSGTKGMDYIPEERDTDHNSKFLAFMRSLGVHSQQEYGTGGSFGFGKAAYFGLSPFSIVLTTTKTLSPKGEICNYFEGTAWLSTHEYEKNGKKIMKSHVGYYDNNNGEPTWVEKDIPDFFQRKNDETGTTFHILGVETSNRVETYSQMVKAVLENFWLAIHFGELKVEIGDIYNRETINKENLLPKILEYEEKDDQFVKRSPKQYLLTLINDDKKLSLHKSYDLNNFFVVPKDTTGRKEWGEIHISIRKDNTGNNKFQHLRRLLMKVEDKGGFNKEGFYGVTRISDGYANELLQKTEPPAHDKWESQRLKARSNERKEATALLSKISELEQNAIAEIFDYASRSHNRVKDINEYCAIRTERSKINENNGNQKNNDFTTEKENDKIISPKNKSEGVVLDTITSETTPSFGGKLKGGTIENQKPKEKKERKGRKRPGNTDIDYKKDPDGKQRRVYDSRKTKIHCVVTKDESGELIHTLLVTLTEESLADAALVISVQGAYGSQLLKIKKDFLKIGKVYDSAPNIITSLKLNKGLNKIPIKFEDSTKKFALKLSVKSLI